MMTIPQLLDDRARTDGDRVMVVFEDREHSYRDISERAGRVAGNLKKRGVGPGDKVALLLGNCPEYLYCFLGLGRIGAVMVPVNPTLTFEEYVYIIRNAEASVMVVIPEFLPALQTILASLPLVRRVFVVGEAGWGAESFEELLAPVDIPEIIVDESSDAAIIYTSGTTGDPKGVELTHGNYLWDTLSMYRSTNLNREDRFLCILPLFHVNAQVVSVLTPMMAGATIVLGGGQFNPFAILPMIEKHRITIMSAVPTIYGLLARLPKAETHDVSSVRFFVSGAAPLSEAIYQAVQRVFKKPLIMGYGLTEATCASAVADHEDPIRWNSVGPPLRYTSVRIVDEQGLDVPIGEAGEVWIAGPTVMKGYYKNPEATAEVMVDGWLKTGDIGRVDREGYLYILDRVKDMIIRGGLNIYSAQLEHVIMRMPEVDEVAVIGVEEPTWGQEVLAVVKLKAECALTERVVIDFCKEHLAAYKVPRYVRFVDALPKTPIGKVRKNELVRQYADIALRRSGG